LAQKYEEIPLSVLKADGKSYYLPFKCILEEIMSNSRFCDVLLDKQIRSEYPIPVMRDVKDSPAFLYRLNTNRDYLIDFKLICFLDELEVCNPLGSYGKKHKLTVLYCTFANIPPQYRSQLSSIYVLAICKSENL
jgi:hypothetical protein